MGSISKWPVLLMLLLSSCTGFIYQPDKYLYANPEKFNVDFDVLTLNSYDGTKLSAWKLKTKTKPVNLVLFFHGNAQNITSHFVNLYWLTEHSTDVIIFDYRGYGLSEGKPNPKGVSEDGLSMLNYAYTQFKAGGYKKFIIYTQSLGGAIALKSLEDFKNRDEISLLVLDSTFLSPRKVAREKTNRVLQFLISDEATADPKLSNIIMPVLGIHSFKDPVIPYQLGKELFDSVPSLKKEFWALETPGHGDVFFIEKNKYREKFLKVLDN
jgi:fermentation-respiration switch protein FrsA (DUF1100 family)